MLAADYVKDELASRLAAELPEVSVSRDRPLDATGLGSTHPDFKLAVYALAASASIDVDAVGGGFTRWSVSATVPVVCRAESRTTSRTTAEVDAQLVAMAAAVLKVVAADHTLGKAPGTDAQIPNLYCRATGWDQAEYSATGDGRLLGALVVSIAVDAVVQFAQA